MVLQCLAWMLITLLAIDVLGPLLRVSVPPFVQPGNLLELLGFFTLGRIALLCRVRDSGCDRPADEQNFAQLLGPVMVALIVPMIVMSSGLISPDGALAVALSLIPASTPVAVFVHVIIGEPAALQAAAAVVGVVLVTVLGVWAAAKVFRLGILLTGKKGTFDEIARLLGA